MKKLLLMALLSVPFITQAGIPGFALPYTPLGEGDAQILLNQVHVAVFRDNISKEDVIKGIKETKLQRPELFEDAAIIKIQQKSIEDIKEAMEQLKNAQHHDPCMISPTVNQQILKEYTWMLARMEVVLQVFEEAFANQA